MPPTKEQLIEALHERTENDFSFHPATPGSKRGALHDEVRRICREAAHALIGLTPLGRDQSLMVTALEEVMMRGNKAIACASDEDLP